MHGIDSLSINEPRMGEGGGFSHLRMILGWRRYLGIPGYLDKGGGGGGGGREGGGSSPHPRMILGWRRY